MLTIESTVPEYLMLREPARSDLVEAWVNEYEAAHAEIFETYYTAYGHPDGRRAAAALVVDLAPTIIEREARARSTLAVSYRDLVSRGLMHADDPLDVVLMVGTGHSDAWVAITNDNPVLYVALEMLPEPERDSLLVLHELIHVVHVRALLPQFEADPAMPYQVGMRVWLEGLAVAASRLLRPGHPDADYLFAPDDQWAERCQRALPDLAATLLSNLTTADPTIGYSMCGVTEDEPWPSRAGYWVGDNLVREVLDSGHDLTDLIAWDIDRVTRAFRESRLLSPHFL